MLRRKNEARYKEVGEPVCFMCGAVPRTGAVWWGCEVLVVCTDCALEKLGLVVVDAWVDRLLQEEIADGRRERAAFEDSQAQVFQHGIDHCLDRLKGREKPKSRKEEYREYLRSDHWQERRRMAVRGADGACQVCNARDKQLEVHHRTYERLGAEEPWDLVVLCEDCHGLFHSNGKLQAA